MLPFEVDCPPVVLSTVAGTSADLAPVALPFEVDCFVDALSFAFLDFDLVVMGDGVERK